MTPPQHIIPGITKAPGAVLVFLMVASWPASLERQAPGSHLTSQEFWDLTQALSEPPGFYPSDNLVSSECCFADVVSTLNRVGKLGGVYLGVGPEQNFHYIAALKPSIAFIVDIRQGNRNLHLLYKALFELAGDRADFLALLFSRRRPSGVRRDSAPRDLISKFQMAQPLPASDFEENVRVVLEVLVKRHRFPLSADDLTNLRWIYSSFHWHGLNIKYTPGSGGGGLGAPTYAALMQEADASGQPRSYLATERDFAFVKQLHTRNLIVPVVGDFAGATAIRAVGAHTRARSLEASAFYVSTVESDLVRDGRWLRFCSNVSSLPLHQSSVFIRIAPREPFPMLDGSARWPKLALVGDSGFSLDPILPEMRYCRQ